MGVWCRPWGSGENVLSPSFLSNSLFQFLNYFQTHILYNRKKRTKEDLNYKIIVFNSKIINIHSILLYTFNTSFLQFFGMLFLLSLSLSHGHTLLSSFYSFSLKLTLWRHLPEELQHLWSQFFAPTL